MASFYVLYEISFKYAAHCRFVVVVVVVLRPRQTSMVMSGRSTFPGQA